MPTPTIVIGKGMRVDVSIVDIKNALDHCLSPRNNYLPPLKGFKAFWETSPISILERLAETYGLIYERQDPVWGAFYAPSTYVLHGGEGTHPLSERRGVTKKEWNALKEVSSILGIPFEVQGIVIITNRSANSSE